MNLSLILRFKQFRYDQDTKPDQPNFEKLNMTPMISKAMLLLFISVTAGLTNASVHADGPAEADSKAASKPNILFIAIDDQNDWIGCMKGHPMVKTPNIDALAKRGTLFSNAHCQSPLCNSSRTSLLFSLRPSTTGIYGLAPWIRTLPQYDNHRSLPQYFSDSGYKTYTCGKIFHGQNGRKKKDKEFDVVGQGPGVGIRPPKKLVNTPSEHKLVDWGVFPHQDNEKGDWKVADWAIEQLEGELKENDQPFFLSVGFFLPHVPCYATQKWFDLYPDDRSVLPPLQENDRSDTPRFSWYLHWKLPECRQKFLIDANEEVNIVRSYLACTSFVDSQVARVMDALEKSGKADNTIVVLWSDHGWHLGEKEITGKNTLWEESTRVPLIFAGPGISKNADCVQPAELLDIYPTLVELCGLPENEKLQGRSLMPQINDANAVREFPAITTHNHDNHSIRSVRYRYIKYADGSEEFYDFKDDPQEWTNIVKNPEYASRIEAHRKFIPTTNVMPAPNSKNRILTHQDGKTIWEGEEIKPTDPIPEID
jgi:arylsulfatase A-like enzyme